MFRGHNAVHVNIVEYTREQVLSDRRDTNGNRIVIVACEGLDKDGERWAFTDTYKTDKDGITHMESGTSFSHID